MRRKRKEDRKKVSHPSEDRRVSKKRLLILAKEFSSSRIEDEASAIAAEPMNVATLVATTTRPFGATHRGIVIKEPL